MSRFMLEGPQPCTNIFQGRKLTFLGRRQLATDLFFQLPNGKMWSASCEILVDSVKVLVTLATRKVQFPTPSFVLHSYTMHELCNQHVSVG